MESKKKRLVGTKMLKKLIYLLMIALILIVYLGERKSNSLQLSEENTFLTQKAESQTISGSFSKKLKLGKPVKIVFLGDYVTSADSLPDGSLNHIALLDNWFDENYPDQVTMINAGMNANTTAHMKERIKKDMIRHKPDLVVISAGSNDALGAWKIPVKEYTTNYQAIVDAIVDSADTEVLIRTPNPTTSPEENTIMGPYINASRKLAEQDEVYLFDFYQVMASDVDSRKISQLDLMENKLIPNIKGQAYLAEQFIAYLTSNLIKP